MKSAPPLADREVNRWLIVLAAGGLLFLATTTYSLFHALRPTANGEPTRPGAEAAAGARPAPEWHPQPDAAESRVLAIPVAPATPEKPDRTTENLFQDQSHQQAVQAQADYLREQSRKYTKGPLHLSAAQIDEMEKQGRMAW